MSDFESQQDEIEALQSIFTEEEFQSFKEGNQICGQFNAFVTVPEGFIVSYMAKKEISDKDKSSQSSSGESKEASSPSFQKTLNVQHLPPILLRFKLPRDYPSKRIPRIVISCVWLTVPELLKLCRQLQKIWSENKGFVVLYSWAQFLKDDCLSFLHFDKSLDITLVEEFTLKKENRTRNVTNTLDEDWNLGNGVGESSKEEEEPRKEEEEPRKAAEELFSVLDLSSVSDKEKDEQAMLVKLSLYDSSSNEENVKSSLYETNCASEETDVESMIVFDKDVEVKRSLYECHGSSKNQGNDETGSEPSCSKGSSRQIGFSDRRINGKANRSEGRNRHRKSMKKGQYRRENLRYWCRVNGTKLTEPLWNFIVEYNKMRRKRDFDYQMFCCAVCFEEKIGSLCMELENCNHVFCRECLTSFLSVCILEGKVKQLSCPDTNCDNELLQSEIRSLVSPELFAKYDSILLATTLDTLNVTYCPRKFCSYPVSPDSESMAVCPQCHYCFCPFCKMVYHGVEPCRFKLDTEEMKALIKEYGNCSETRKGELEKRYGRKHLQQLVDRSLTETWISNNSKQCPKCNSSIERTDGCNKMVCLRCNTPFCWLCFEILNHPNPYSHFNAGRCAGKLFFGVETDPAEDAVIDDLNEELDDDEFFVDDDFLEDPRLYFIDDAYVRQILNGIMRYN